MNNVWLSIIIPIYNPPKESFESAFQKFLENQSNDIEILLIDDGSDTWVEEYIEERIRGRFDFKYWKKPNGGVSSARNFGIEHARGEYLCFADADDELYIDAICSMRHEIPAQIAMVVFDFIREQIDNKVQTRISLLDKSKTIKIEDEGKDYFCYKKMRESVAKLYNKKFLLKNKIQFDINMVQAEDLVFLYEVMNHCKEFYYCHKIVYRYLWDMETTNGRITKKPLKRLEDAEKAYLVQCDFFKGDRTSIDLCTDSFINTLGSRTLLLMYYDKFSKEVKEKVKDLFYLSVRNSNLRRNSKAKVYQFLFHNNLWICFKILSRYRYKGKKRCID